MCLFVYVYSSLLGHLPVAQVPAGLDRRRSRHCFGGGTTVTVSKVTPTASLFEIWYRKRHCFRGDTISVSFRGGTISVTVPVFQR